MRPSVTFMVTEPCTCCHGTGRVEALETSFSKIEHEICRLLVSKSLSAQSPLIPSSVWTAPPLFKSLNMTFDIAMCSLFLYLLQMFYLDLPKTGSSLLLPDVATSFGNQYLQNHLRLDAVPDFAIAFSFSDSLKSWHGSFCNKICASILLGNMIILDRRE